MGIMRFAFGGRPGLTGARIKELQEKLVQRIRPFVDAKNPGEKDDHETKVFEARIRTEAEDLKLESFGIEVGCVTTRGRC